MGDKHDLAVKLICMIVSDCILENKRPSEGVIEEAIEVMEEATVSTLGILEKREGGILDFVGRNDDSRI